MAGIPGGMGDMPAFYALGGVAALLVGAGVVAYGVYDMKRERDEEEA
jgi:hypothetical protein